MKPCCADPANRREGLGPRGDANGFREGPEVSHCVICSCRHVEATLEPGKLGVTGKAL